MKTTLKKIRNVLFILISIFHCASFADAVVKGYFAKVVGTVKVQSGGKTENAAQGRKVFSVDVIEVGADSRAQLVMKDKNILSLAANTTLSIQTYELGPKNKKVDLLLTKGKVRAAVNQRYDDNENTFQIKTPSLVAGVRGTEFVTSFDEATKTSNVVTVKGTVAVKPFDALGKIGSPVLVTAGMMVQQPMGSATPLTPTEAPKEILKNIEAEKSSSLKDQKGKSSGQSAKNGEDVQELSVTDSRAPTNRNNVGSPNLGNKDDYTKDNSSVKKGLLKIKVEPKTRTDAK